MILPPDQRSPHPGGETAPQFEQAPPTPVARKRRRARAPPVLRDYLTKRDLVLLVPLSMTTIDRLERQGIFPARFVIAPTNKVAGAAARSSDFMSTRAARRVSTKHRNRRGLRFRAGAPEMSVMAGTPQAYRRNRLTARPRLTHRRRVMRDAAIYGGTVSPFILATPDANRC